MTEQEVFDKVVAILEPFAKNAAGVTGVQMTTSILKDLEVNSARLVDIVIELEDAFQIEVSDEDADNVRTVGDAVQLILKQKEAA